MENKVEESSTESSSSDEDEDNVFESPKEGKHGKMAHIGVDIPDEDQLDTRRNSTC